METVIVIIIVGAAVGWAIRRVVRMLTFKQPNSCGCDCSSTECANAQANQKDRPDSVTIQDWTNRPPKSTV